jgi:NADPH:quinone reductase-like Zn-dependent oxidoreductase
MAMRIYRLRRGAGIEGLELTTTDAPVVGPGEVRIRVRAVSLNQRDLNLARGASGGDPYTPCSDGAGEVVEVGAGVDRWRIGDRVLATFYPAWTDGPPSEAATAAGLGGGALPGMLAEKVVLPQQALVAVPPHLHFEEAATLPCAGVTAWNALFRAGRATAGQSVLLLGTGGVSVWALQLAKAAGLRAIVTSSSDAKLAVARSLGADAVINYRSEPRWHEAVRRETGGCGVDLVVEVGGRDTLVQSLSAARAGGTIALVGGVSGGFGIELPPFALIDRAQTLAGVLVGSREMAQELAAFTELTRLRPVIDRRFRFEQACEAFEYLAGGGHVGKVVVQGPESA